MNKLKFIKTVVFILTFCIVFLLCAAVSKIIQNRHQPKAKIELTLDSDTKILQFQVAEDKLFLLTDQQKIYVIDLNQGKKESTIYFSGSTLNGKE